MKRINIISMSGGKDSTALALLAIEQKTENMRFVFADTGHEHQLTYDYIDYLRKELNINIEVVKANFDREFAVRRKNLCKPDAKKTTYIHKKNKKTGLKTKKKIKGWTNKARVRALSVLHPTGNPFLDLCLLKGRFPSTRSRFCSSELKHIPISTLILDELEKGNQVYSWQGVRAQESKERANLDELEEVSEQLFNYRPILDWGVDRVFEMHKQHNIKPNPLYKMGMGRVGCMPCIHCKKSELKSISYRFPNEIERVSEMESLVALASKRGLASFFSPDKTPKGKDIRDKNRGKVVPMPQIHDVVEWSKTTRGGRIVDLFADEDEEMSCSSQYGLCE